MNYKEVTQEVHESGLYTVSEIIQALTAHIGVERASEIVSEVIGQKVEEMPEMDITLDIPEISLDI